MGSLQGDTLNQAQTTLTETSAQYGDDGSGNTKWFHNQAQDDGANVALGATTDAAVTNPATDSTLIAFTRGILTQLSSILTKLTAGALSVTKLEDAAHATGDAGVMTLAVRKDTAAVSSGTSGDYEPLQTDSLGRLRTTVGRTLTNKTSTALEATNVVKASAGTLYGINGHAETAGYILIGNKATALNGTSDAVFAVVKVAEGPWSIDYGLFGRTCSAGISVGFSSTVPGFTSGGSNMWIDAQYE